MVDRDEIIRRIISGDMSRGGADFAARMAAARMGTPEQMYAQYALPTQADLDQRFRDSQRAPMLTPGIPPAPMNAGMAPDVPLMMPAMDTPPNATTQAGLGAPMMDAPPMLETGTPLAPGVDAPGLWSAIAGPMPGASNAASLLAAEVITPEEYQQLTQGSRGQQSEVLANAARRKVGTEPQPTDVPSVNLSGLTGGAPDMTPPASPIETNPRFPYMSGSIGMPDNILPGDTNTARFPVSIESGAPMPPQITPPQAGLPPAPGPMAIPPTTPGATDPMGGGGGGAGLMGGIDMDSLPSGAAVSPSNPDAYNPETGTRDPEVRALSIWDRMFGEPGTDRRSAMSQALMRMGAVMMSTNGNLGQALGAGIQEGLLEYDETMKALSDEAKEARKMGMEEEAFQIDMEMKRLQLARARAGGVGGRGARTSGVVENPLEAARTNALVMESLGFPLTPEQQTFAYARALNIPLPASAAAPPKQDPVAAIMAQ